MRGLLRTARAGHVGARALAVADSRALVRSLFLASAVRAGLLDWLGDGRGLAEIAARLGVVRLERLQAWLGVGTELGELAERGGRYRVRGRRARAIAAGDTLLRAHYRSMLDCQRVALYRRLGALMDDRGRLIVASQTAPGSVAAAHLNFMLTCQAGAAALPGPGELEADLSSAGFELTDVAFIVPTEPFLAITAARR